MTTPHSVHETHTADSALSAAIAYLESVGETLERVSTRRHLMRGWEFYSPSAMQMLSRADVLEFAANTRELHS